MIKFLKNLINLFALIVLAYIFQDQLGFVVNSVKKEVLPCKSPVVYTIGDFDTRFNVSETEFLSFLKDAENVWEEASGIDLFEYSENSGMRVNLIFDERQEVTNKLQKIDGSLNIEKESYDSLKNKYDDMRNLYLEERALFSERMTEFERRNEEYASQVEYWNGAGGASRSMINDLEKEHKWLGQESNDLYQIQLDLNEYADDLNSLAVLVNEKAGSLNQKVNEYNTIGSTYDREFEEGTYHTGPDGTWIDIYQFENETKLRRVLMHEFGHAVGMDHVVDEDAIMYFLNESSSLEIKKDDLLELESTCSSFFSENIL